MRPMWPNRIKWMDHEIIYRARRHLYILPLSRVQIGFRSCGQNYGQVQGFLLDVGQDGTAKVMLRTAAQDTNMGAYEALCSMLPEVPRGEADHVFTLELGYKVAGMVGEDVVMQYLDGPEEVAWYNNHDPGSWPPRTSKCQLRAEILKKGMAHLHDPAYPEKQQLDIMLVHRSAAFQAFLIQFVSCGAWKIHYRSRRLPTEQEAYHSLKSNIPWTAEPDNRQPVLHSVEDPRTGQKVVTVDEQSRIDSGAVLEADTEEHNDIEPSDDSPIIKEGSVHSDANIDPGLLIDREDAGVRRLAPAPMEANAYVARRGRPWELA